MPTLLAGLILLLMLLGLPPLGLALAGRELGPYLAFPPLTEYVRHAPFAWPAFLGLALLLIATILPFIVRIARCNRGYHPPPRPRYPFPWWGGLGLAISAAAWVLAWTRLPAFASIQPYTFTPQWLGYILVVQALTQRRSGACTLTSRPGFMLLLFPVSAAFWWFFEYLNRFVQNWSYQNIGDLSPQAYFLFATLPFATVLPAVLGTFEWLQTFPRLSRGLDAFIAFRPRHPRRLAAASLLLAGAGLAAVGLRPDLLFPLLWLAPLVIIASLQTLRGRPTLCTPLRSGDWRALVLWALAALVCGFFWELWNMGSLARWIYHIPYVQRFPIFEMPLLGYAGYFTFGLECAVVTQALSQACKRTPTAAA